MSAAVHIWVIIVIAEMIMSGATQDNEGRI